jgi:hypothetical protein
MAQNQSDDMGKFARHPLRTMGGSMLMGASFGAGMMAAKNRRNKSMVQKFMDRMNK